MNESEPVSPTEFNFPNQQPQGIETNNSREKRTEYIKWFRVKGCGIEWHKNDEEAHGQTSGNYITIWGKRSPDLAWTLAHELAHALEPEEKKPHPSGELAGKPTVEIDSPDRMRHSLTSGRVYYPKMSREEFYASYRSRRYLEIACGLLGISLKDALNSDPPEHLRNWFDDGYFYQWRAQLREKRKVNSKRYRRQAAQERITKREEESDRQSMT